MNLIFETCKMRAISHHKENFIEDLCEVINVEHIAHLIESTDFFIKINHAFKANFHYLWLFMLHAKNDCLNDSGEHSWI